MSGAAIAIENASAADTILSVKQLVFAVNRKMSVRRQRLVYCPGPHGMESLADGETLSGAGVAQDGSARLDVLLVDLTEAETADLNEKVRMPLLLLVTAQRFRCCFFCTNISRSQLGEYYLTTCYCMGLL
jgi:hypothetical protein